MPLRRRLLPSAIASLLGLAAACNFDAQGLGEATGVALSVSGSSGELPGSTGQGSTAAGPETGSSDGDTSSGEPVCSSDCPPIPEWTVTTPGDAHALVLDPAGDAVVVGDRAQASNPVLSDVWAAKFTGRGGAQIWEARHNGDQKGHDFGRGVALAADGTVVVVGGSREVANRRVDLWVGWLAGDTGELLNSGNLMTGHWNGEDGQLDEWAEAVASDADGGLVVVGSRCLADCEVPDAWIGRFDAAGAALWAEPMLPVSAGSFRGLLVDRDLLLPFGTDGYDGSSSSWRTLVRRLDGNGAGTWSALPDPPGQEELGFIALAAALADDGGLWVVGREIAVGAERGFLRLYHPDRGDTPVAQLRGDALAGSLSALVLTADGAPLVAGSSGRGSTRHLWLAQFTAGLAPMWHIDEAADEVTEARGLAHDPDGGLVVLGVRLPGDGMPVQTWLRRYVPAVAP